MALLSRLRFNSRGHHLCGASSLELETLVSSVIEQGWPLLDRLNDEIVTESSF